tara:strand:- start:1032 stop:1241 length:210 start_codon:yes stop_codon:yes gene_type:complete
MGEILDRLKQHCPSCEERVLARRIEGRYVNERNTRILIWECIDCGTLWQKARRKIEKEKPLAANEAWGL